MSMNHDDSDSGQTHNQFNLVIIILVRYINSTSQIEVFQLHFLFSLHLFFSPLQMWCTQWAARRASLVRDPLKQAEPTSGVAGRENFEMMIIY
jgi:hypothetical protein